MPGFNAGYAVLPAALAAALALAACGGDEDGGEEAATESGCREVEAPPAKQVSLSPPGKQLGRREQAVAVFRTSCGSFEVTLDGKRAPKTAGSFAHLVEQGVYDDTGFHRVVPDFVVQGGDPEGSGQGGPGYSIEEPPPDSIAYTKGVVAMAKSGAEPPGTSGSQFFVVTAEDAGLPAIYALVGKVTAGMETIERIEALGEPGSDGPPSSPVVVEKATLK